MLDNCNIRLQIKAQYYLFSPSVEDTVMLRWGSGTTGIIVLQSYIEYSLRYITRILQNRTTHWAVLFPDELTASPSLLCVLVEKTLLFKGPGVLSVDHWLAFSVPCRPMALLKQASDILMWSPEGSRQAWFYYRSCSSVPLSTAVFFPLAMRTGACQIPSSLSHPVWASPLAWGWQPFQQGGGKVIQTVFPSRPHGAVMGWEKVQIAVGSFRGLPNSRFYSFLITISSNISVHTFQKQVVNCSFLHPS